MSWLESFVIKVQNRNQKKNSVSLFIRQDLSKWSTKLRPFIQSTPSLFQRSITPISNFIHLVSLRNTFISEILHSTNHNYNGLQDTTFASLVSAVCVAQFQSSHRRSAASPSTRLCHSVTRLHNTARSLYRTNRRDHRNSLLTNPTVHAENCGSWVQTHSTHSSRNGQWEQTDPDAIRA
jgi:hypothetical protein